MPPSSESHRAATDQASSSSRTGQRDGHAIRQPPGEDNGAGPQPQSMGEVRVESMFTPPRETGCYEPPVHMDENDPPALTAPPLGNDPVAPPIEVYQAESIIEHVDLVEEHSLPVRAWLAVCSVVEWCFGVACVLVALAILASIPIIQFFSLGYLLEASGRVSRSGKLRDGLIGVRPAARLGSLFLGTWMVLLPAQFAAEMLASARLIDPESDVVTGWRIGLFVITGLVVAHTLLAWYCGGKLRHFFWPVLAPLFFLTWSIRRLVASQALRPLIGPLVGRISPRLLSDLTTVPALTSWFPPAIFLAGVRRGKLIAPARDAVWEFAVGLRPQYYFWLGFRGFAGAVIWLFIPIMMMMATTSLELKDADAAQGLGALAGFAGSVLLAGVLLYLPFLQAHFAAERRFRAFFEIGRVRQLFRRAPIALTCGLLVTLAFALPLYLLKIETVPSELLWALSLVFVVFGLPARLIMGWAMGRARRRESPRHVLVRWLASVAELPIVGFYVFFVFFTQYYVWNGSASLLEQHAFLPPVPFLALLGG